MLEKDVLKLYGQFQVELKKELRALEKSLLEDFNYIDEK
jgi:hypothetical protein